MFLAILNKILIGLAICTYVLVIIEFTGSEPYPARHLIRETILFCCAMFFFLTMRSASSQRRPEQEKV
jgi:hypothetical protein